MKLFNDMETKQCPVCQKNFEAPHGKIKYCSPECVRKIRNIEQNERRRKDLSEKNCSKCGSNFLPTRASQFHDKVFVKAQEKDIRKFLKHTNKKTQRLIVKNVIFKAIKEGFSIRMIASEMRSEFSEDIIISDTDLFHVFHYMVRKM